MDIRVATLADLRELDALRASSQEAVGFVPMSKYEWQVNHKADCILTAWENGDMVGYLYWTPGLPVAAIQQVVIRDDARRLERGTALVGAALSAMQSPLRYGVTCRCRVDLEATDFWRACGFQEVRLEHSGARRGPCLRFYRELHPSLLNLGLYLPTKTSGTMSRFGFRVRRVGGRDARPPGAGGGVMTTADRPDQDDVSVQCKTCARALAKLPVAGGEEQSNG